MSADNSQNSSDTENVCVVCFRDVDIFSIGCCDHAVCFECSTRMRVLCKQNECPICRRDLPKVIFTKKIEGFASLFHRFERSNLQDRKTGILFCSYEIQKAYYKLLEHRCQICDENEHKWPFKTFQQLKDHMRREHELYYCDICSENLKIFSFERKCYNRSDLALHRRKGDKDNTSHRGHPLCEFCDTRFMDNDELFRHMRRNHLFCHFCDADGKHQYYSSMEDLKRHFRDEHFLCEDGDCKTMLLTAVFRTDIDLKVHTATAHGKHLSKSATKQARTLEVAFTLAPRPRAENSRNKRGREWSEEDTYNFEPGGSGGGSEPPRATFFNSLSEDNFPALKNTPSNSGNINFSSKNYTKFSNAAFNSNDFPSLGESSTRSAPAVTITTNSASASSGRAPEVTITRTIRGQQSGNQKRENFPALGGPSSSSGGSTVRLSVNSATQDSKAPKVSIHVNQKSNGAITTHITTNPTMQPQTEVFPTLGKPATVSQPKWVQPKSKKQEEPKNSKIAPCPQLPADLSSFPTLQKGKSNEKPKKTSSVTVPVNSWVNLNNINTNVKSGKSNENKRESNNNNNNNKNRLSALDLTLKNLKLLEVDRPAKSDEAKSKSKKKKNKGVAGGDDNDKKSEVNEDPENRNGLVKKRSELKIGTLGTGDDFSSLKVHKPPPGFTVKPPPGFNSSNFPSLSAANDLTFTNSSGQSYSIIPTTSSYRQPHNFQSRNQNLIKRFMNVLNNNEAIKDFKNISDGFRKGAIDGETYYERCRMFLSNSFDEVFPELLVLLPDIDKQQELYQFLTGRSKDKLLVCEQCRQVILKPELSDHYGHHRLETQFPDLGSTTQPVNSVWKK